MVVLTGTDGVQQVALKTETKVNIYIYSNREEGGGDDGCHGRSMRCTVAHTSFNRCSITRQPTQNVFIHLNYSTQAGTSSRPDGSEIILYIYYKCEGKSPLCVALYRKYYFGYGVDIRMRDGGTHIKRYSKDMVMVRVDMRTSIHNVRVKIKRHSLDKERG